MKLLVDAYLVNAVMEGAEEGGVEAGPDGHEVYTVTGGERVSSVAIPAEVHSAMLSRLKDMAGETGSFKISIDGKIHPVKAEFRTTVFGEGVVLTFKNPA